MKNVTVTDAAEMADGGDYVRVTNQDRDTALIPADDKEGVAAAVQQLSGGYGA